MNKSSEINNGPNNVCWFCHNVLDNAYDLRFQMKTKKDSVVNQPETKELLKKSLLYFCENTTIRGISRAVKTTNKTSRIIWVGFFIILCVGLTTCLTFLIRQFFEYNVIHPPRILRNTLSPFPSITICNHRPLSHSFRSFVTKKNMRNPREFASAANSLGDKHFYEKGMIAKYSSLTPFFSLSGYLESIPLEQHVKLGHSLTDFVIDCYVLYRKGSKHINQNCTNSGEWKITPHAQYINCFSYTVNEDITNSTTTIELYIYLNEETNTSVCLDCFKSNVKSQLSGALLVVHKSGSYPNINQEAINLQPGTLTEVRLKTFDNVMKTPPYGRCKPNTPKTLQIGLKVYNYTEHLCKEKIIQEEINMKCNCNVIEYPIINDNLTFCGALPRFIHHTNCNITSRENEIEKCIEELNNAIDRLKCKNSVTVLYHNDVIENCSLPCSYNSYESDRSISSWPTKSWQLTWMNTLLGRKIIEKEELKEYKKASELFNRNKKDSALLLLNKQDMLEKKLVAVLLNKPNKNLHKVEEKEVLSLTSFLSQMGGLFSIWIGLTLISIVEVIELLMRIFEIIKKKIKPVHIIINVTEDQKGNQESCEHFIGDSSVTNL